MHIDPAQATVSEIYSTMIRAITPRPIAWVSSLSADGIPNLAPFSYFNGVGSQPAALMFSVVNHPDGSKKDTARNIEATREFVVNVVPFSSAEKMTITAGHFDYETNEFESAGLTQQPSRKIKPPRVAESPIHLECKLLNSIAVGEGPSAANVFIGQIVWIEISDDVLDEQNKIDPLLVDTIGRMGGRSYSRTRDLFEATRS